MIPLIDPSKPRRDLISNVFNVRDGHSGKEKSDRCSLRAIDMASRAKLSAWQLPIKDATANRGNVVAEAARLRCISASHSGP